MVATSNLPVKINAKDKKTVANRLLPPKSLPFIRTANKNNGILMIRFVIHNSTPPGTMPDVSSLMMIAKPVTPPVTRSRGTKNIFNPAANKVVPIIIMM